MKAGGTFLGLLASAMGGFLAAFFFLRDSPAAPSATPTASDAMTMEVGPTNRVESALAACVGAKDLRQLAALERLLFTLDAAQMADLLNRVDGLPRPARVEYLPLLLGWWAANDAAAATAWFAPRLAWLKAHPPDTHLYFHPAGRLLTAWAENTPRRALELAREWNGHPFEKDLLLLAVSNWPDQRTGAWLLGLLNRFPDGGARRHVLGELLPDFAKKDPVRTLAAARNFPPGKDRMLALALVLQRTAEMEPVKSLVQALEFGVRGEAEFRGVLDVAARQDGAATAHWLLAQDDPLVASNAAFFVNRWAAKEPLAALAWAHAHGVSPVEIFEYPRDPERPFDVTRIYDTALALAFRGESESRGAAWLQGLPAGAKRDRLAELALPQIYDAVAATKILATLPGDAAAIAAQKVAQRMADRQSLELAIAWTQALPAGPIRERAWQGIGESGKADAADPGETARKALAALPRGPERDALLAGRTVIRFSSHDTYDLLPEIGDPVLRRQAFDEVTARRGNRVNEESIVSNVTLLEKAQAPEEWKTRWLERFRSVKAEAERSKAERNEWLKRK